jgi:serine protease SohB
MHWVSDYTLFLIKTITVIIALLILAAGIAITIAKGKNKEKCGKLTIHKINEKYQNYQEIMEEALLNKAEKKSAKKALKKQMKELEKSVRPKLFVLEFSGDIKASAVNSLREEITALLLTAKPEDQVLLMVESPGGLVHAYGLAAAQIQRIKDAKIKLVIAVDKIAASGGYLIACLADYLIAAPFAVIGSIGVIAQLPNFHRWLEKKDIDFEQIYAGQYKRTLNIFGKNTPEGREKLQEEINDAHELFKSFITRYRPQVTINQVATGEHWYGVRALELKLLDEIKTSDDYLLTAKNTHDLFQIKYEVKKTLNQKIGAAANLLLSKLVSL